MAEYTSSIELKAVTGQLQKKLKDVNKSLKGIDTQVQKTQGAFAKMGNKVGGTFDKLNAKLKEHKAQIAGITVAVSAMALKGVSDFKKFEDGMAQIGTLGVKNLKQIESQLDVIRKSFGISGAEATKGYYDIISAGAKEGKEALDQLTAATKLAKAGATDLGGAIDIVTSGINIFGAQGETASTITDKLFLAVKFGKTTVEELGQTFGFVAPVVAAAGLSMDDYAASMAAVTAGGIQTKQATTGIKAVLSNLIKVTPKAEKAAKRLGIEFGVTALKSKGLVGVMQDIKEKTGGDITELGKLFDSIEAINTVAVMTSEGGLKNLSRNFEAMGASAGTTQTALEKVKKTASFNFSKFNQSLSIMSKNIGAALVPALIDMADAFAPVVDFFAALIAQHPGIIKVGAAVTGLVASLAFLGGPFTILLAGATAGLVGFMKHFKAFEEGGIAALEKFSLAWDNFWAGFRKEDGSISFSKLIDGAVGWVSKMASGIKKEVVKLSKWFVDPIVKMATAVERAFFWVYDQVIGHSWIPDLVKGIQEWTGKLWNWFVNPIKKMTGQVEGYFKDMADLTPTQTAKKVWQDLSQVISDAMKDASEETKKYLKEIKAEIKELGQEIDGSMEGFQDVANLAAIGPIMRGLTATTLLWKKGVDSLGLSMEQPLTGFNKLSKISFTSQASQLQKVTQALREMQAAVSDDMGKTISTDNATRARAYENATKFEQRIRAERIARAKTLGNELAKIRAGQLEAELKSIEKSMGAKADKLKRGFFSRMMFGEGTMHTWGAKLNGLLEQMGKGFDKLGEKAMKVATHMDKAMERAAARQVKVDQRIADNKVKSAEKGLKTAKTAASKAKLEAPFGMKTQSAAEVLKTQKRLIEAERALKAAKLAQIEATIATNRAANVSLAQMNKIQKLFSTLGKTLGLIGTSVRTVVEQATKMTSFLRETGTKLANSKFAQLMKGGAKWVGDFTKITPALKVLSGIARKILIPVFAAIDAFKGFTDKDNLEENTGKSINDIDMVDKTLSAAAEALGNFFSGFLNLGGTILKYFGADELGKYLESIDLAPKFGKFFQAVRKIFKAVANIFGAIFGGEGGEGESGFTKLVKRIGDLLNKFLDTLSEVADGILKITEGDVSGGLKKIAGAVLDMMGAIAKALLDGVVSAVKGVATWAGGLVKDLFTGIYNWFTGLFKSEENKASQRIKENGPQSKKHIGKYATGGHVTGPGSGTSDDIPAMLSNGEFVINAQSTKKNRALLEAINDGGGISKFANGGYVRNKSDQGTQSYQFMQFAKGGSFDFSETMGKWVNHLDMATPAVKQVVEQMEYLRDNSENLSKQEILKHDYTRRINRALIELNKNKKEEAIVTADSTGAVRDMGEAAKTVANEWKGMGQELTGPIKQAFMEGGSIKDGLKMGLHNLFTKMAGKFLDQAFKPMEDALDSFINNLTSQEGGLFGGISNLFSGTGSGSSGGGFLSGLFGGGSTSTGSSGGGLFDFIGGLFNDGGIVPQYLATGGVATSNGPKGSDTVPAWLTPGEVVLNAGQQKNVANAMGANGGAVYNTYNLEVTGNVDQRAIEQIRNIIQSSPNQVNNAANTGKRNASGIRRR